MEYQRNRLEVISAQREAYKQIEQLFADTRKKLESHLKGYKRHPLIDTDALLSSINAAFDAQAQELGKVRQRHPDLLQEDDVRDALTKLLDGKVGRPYPEDKLKQIYKEGEGRYAKSKPPGYEDAKSKDGDSVFGDLVLWFQIIDKAVSDKVPVVIVTDDVKEDWWWRHEGKIVGPNPELVDEMRSKAKVDFYMYVSDQFMQYAREYLKQNVDQGAIDEIREVRKLDEQRRFHSETLLASKERRLSEFRHELAAIESEVAHINAERSALNQQLSELSLQPIETSEAAHRQEFIAALVSRMQEMEARQHYLEEHRRRLGHHVSIEMEERNMLLHRGLGGERYVRLKDGTVRRVARAHSPSPELRNHEPTPVAEPVREHARQLGERKKGE